MKVEEAVQDAQGYAEAALQHIRHLSEAIGPRGSTTPGERRAAEYARDALRRLGIEPRLETFNSGQSTYRPFVLAFGTALAGALAYVATRHPIASLLAAAPRAVCSVSCCAVSLSKTPIKTPSAMASRLTQKFRSRPNTRRPRSRSSRRTGRLR